MKCNEEIQKYKKRISNLQNKLYYIKNKKVINQKRKKYKRQSWENRKDNPKDLKFKPIESTNDS